MFLELAIAIFYLFCTFLFLGGIFLVFSILAERFILTTLPLLADLWFRIKYPHEYAKENKD